MKTQTYRASLRKIGNAWYVNVPAQYIRDGSIDPSKDVAVLICNSEVSNGQLL